MAKRPLPSPETLRQLLRYEPETGKLFWRERGPEWFSPSGRNSAIHQSCVWNTRYADSLALNTPDSHGYLHGRIFKKKTYAHRAAWIINHGSYPEGSIDHIDGDKRNNRISNLRIALPTENGWNRGKNKNNTTGYKGVFYDKRDGFYYARIGVDGQSFSLGRSQTAEGAHNLYVQASQKMHGDFSRTE